MTIEIWLKLTQHNLSQRVVKSFILIICVHFEITITSSRRTKANKFHMEIGECIMCMCWMCGAFCFEASITCRRHISLFSLRVAVSVEKLGGTLKHVQTFQSIWNMDGKRMRAKKNGPYFIINWARKLSAFAFICSKMFYSDFS